MNALKKVPNNNNPIIVQYAGVRRLGLPAAVSFKRWARYALQKNISGLGIRLVDEVEIASLNQCYRQKEGTTNVLSFPVEPLINEQTKWLGDIVICPTVAAEQACQQGKKLQHHLAHLTIHGVLHLRGYNHMEDTDAYRMESLEVQLLETLGIANPYISNECYQ